VWGRHTQPSIVARGSEPSAKLFERSGKRGLGGVRPHQRLKILMFPAVASRLQDKPSAEESGGVGAVIPDLLSLPAVASRLQDKPSAAESGGSGAAAPTCDSKTLKVSYTAAAIRESASARRLGERQRTSH
jgi:hypothetical protein